MTLSDPKPGFQGHGILKSRISHRRCESFQLYTAQLGSTENVQKMGIVAEFFFAKNAETCFTSLTEIKHNSVSLR